MSFAYDDTALYVGARMSAEHASIQAPLGRRDEGSQTESVVVVLDTYLDHRTAYGFGVTAAGARLDCFYAADEDKCDSETNPVWLARTIVEPSGWTAEMWIPLSQLRFTCATNSLGAERVPVRAASNEGLLDCLPKTVRHVRRDSASCGHRRLKPPRRLELLPYSGLVDADRHRDRSIRSTT